jgi:hypothetical protein
MAETNYQRLLILLFKQRYHTLLLFDLPLHHRLLLLHLPLHRLLLLPLLRLLLLQQGQKLVILLLRGINLTKGAVQTTTTAWTSDHYGILSNTRVL